MQGTDISLCAGSFGRKKRGRSLQIAQGIAADFKIFFLFFSRVHCDSDNQKRFYLHAFTIGKVIFGYCLHKKDTAGSSIKFP